MTDCKYCKEMASWRNTAEFVHEDDEWLIRHEPKPYPLVGWTILYAQRHASGPADFDTKQQAALGPIATALSRAIKDVTGCERVYAASLNEGVQHFHMHFLPRYAGDPKRWNAFIGAENAKQGRSDISNQAVLDFVARLRRRLLELTDETPNGQ